MGDDGGGDALPPGLARAILEAAGQVGIGVLVVSPDGRRVERANGAFARLLGADPSALAGTATARWLPDWTGAERFAHGGPTRSRVHRRDDTRRAIDIATSGASDGDRRVMFVFDADESQRMERELERAESRFRRLIEAAPDAIALTRGDRLLFANHALMALLGGAEVSARWSDHVHPDDRERALSIRSEVLADGTGNRFEERWQVGDSSVRVEVNCIRTEWNGEPAVLEVARDTSVRRAIQSNLIEADRLAAVGSLVAGVAHEINNPLAYVLLNLQYLLRELPRLGDDSRLLERLHERLHDAQHGAGRVGAIVRDLRAFAGSERDRTGPVELPSVLDSAIKMAAPQLRGRGALERSYRAAPLVTGSAPRLEQVFLNLIVNAAQALPEDGSGRVAVELGECPDGSAFVEVRDTGSGIPPELLGRVFDPFFTTKPVGVGTGLGLPICHSIVTGHGGEITVRSASDGTSFRVTLPARREPTRTPTPLPAPVRAGSAARARVLVVDDELPVATMLKQVLSQEHDVDLATSGREALALITGERTFDVVLCDLLMPGMTGMDLHDEVRSTAPGEERKLVFMTGGAFTSGAAKFLQTVPNRHIEKPFDLAEVKRVVRLVAEGADGETSA